MPKRIENPLTSGLPSKICYLSYLNPSTGYSLDKQIHGHVKCTDKIYVIINDLLEKGYLKESKIIDKKNKRVQKPVTLVTAKLISELDDALALNTVSINYENEPEFKNQIKNILDSNEFKEYLMGKDKSTDDRIIDFGTHKIIEKEFNGLQIILETIGMIATLCFTNRKFKKKSAKEDLYELEKIYKKSIPNDWKTLLEGIKKFNAIVTFFEKFKEDTLIKLSTLWSQSHMTIFSHYVEYYKKMEKVK